MSFTLRPYQQEAVDKSVEFLRTTRGKNGLVMLPTGCHAKGTRILMADMSTKAVEDVCVGDQLMGPDGTPRNVVKLHEGTEPMYRITPHRGGDPFVVNQGHILALECTNEGKGNYPSQKNGGERDYVTVGEYLGKSKYWKHMRKLFRCDGINESHCEDQRPVDPWMLGVLLGDGCMLNATASVCTPDPEIVTGIFAFASEWNCAVRVQTKRNNPASAYYFTTTGTGASGRERNPIMNVLRAIGVYGHGAETKSIPDAYKRAGGYVRREILAGLLDTDGHHDGKGGYDWISKSPQLADDVAFVARSLGITAHVTKCRKGCQTGAVGTYYRVNLSGHTQQIPCRVERKKPAPRMQKKNPLRSGFKVEPVGVGDFYGFTLDGDHLYLTEDFTVHHNSGKSLVIAGIVKALGEPTLVFQPSKEILEQNSAKYRSYGYGCGIYSASAGQKNLRDVTFATIGSVVRKKHLLERFKYVLVDECHLVSAKANLIRDKHDRVVGEKLPMYAEVLEHMNVPVLGLTATPYRLSQGSNPVTFETYSELKMLTRTRPRVFDEIVYHVQNRTLFDAGYLAKLVYHEVNVINRNALQRNSTGADYTDRSVREQYKLANFNGKVVAVVRRLLEIGRKNVLVFTRFTEEARFVAANVPGAAIVTAETPSKERERILRGFRDGWIKVVCNVGILTTGFDYPELEAVVMARPTMSLALWYQIVGRGIRPHPDKDHSMIIDMGGNLRQFGKVEDLELSNEGGWHIHSQGRVLTGVPMDARPMPRKTAVAR